MDDQKILELLSKMVKAEAIKIMKQRLENVSYKIEDIIRSLGEETPDELKQKLTEVNNKIVVIENGDAEPDEMDVITVMQKMIGWIWVAPESVQRIGD